MKKIQMLVIALLLSTASFATDLFEEVKIMASSTNEVEVEYFNFESIPTTISIKDERGTVLYHDISKTPASLPRKFILSDLRTQTFLLKIENKNKIVEAKFAWKAGVVSPVGESARFYKPTIQKKGKKVLINLLNPSERPVKIKILDEKNNRLVPDMLVSDRFVRKIIDFSTFRDRVTVIVENGKTFVEEYNF